MRRRWTSEHPVPLWTTPGLGGETPRRCAGRLRSATSQSCVGVALFVLEVGDALFGVGGVVVVDGDGAVEPFEGFGGAAGGVEGVGVGVAQADDPVGVGLVAQRGVLQGAQGGVELALVAAGAGLDDGHLGLEVGFEVGHGGVAGQGQGAVGAAEGAFAVGHHREVVLGAVEAFGGFELGEGVVVVAGGVGGLAAGFADHGDAGGAGAGGLGVGVGGLGVVLEEQAGGDEVPGDAVGELLGQAAQLLGDVVVELLAGDLGVEVGSVVAGLLLGAFAVLAAGPRGRGAGPVPPPVRTLPRGRRRRRSLCAAPPRWGGRCGPRCGTGRTAGPRRGPATEPAPRPVDPVGLADPVAAAAGAAGRHAAPELAAVVAAVGAGGLATWSPRTGTPRPEEGGTAIETTPWNDTRLTRRLKNACEHWSENGLAKRSGKHVEATRTGGLYEEKLSGDVLLSHNLPVAVPSALRGLTSGFGMEPGISLSLWPP